MTDIFAKKSPPARRENLPAPLCEPFIAVFERAVAEAQRAFSSMRDNERAYACIKAALDDAKLPNDRRVLLKPELVEVRISATPKDRWATFQALADDMGERLRKAGCHGDGVPARRVGGFFPEIEHTWHDREFARTVRLNVLLPAVGIEDYSVQIAELQMPYTEYRIEPRKSEPRIVPIRTAADAEEVAF